MKVIKFILLKIYMVWVLLVFSVFMIIFLPLIVVPIVIGQRYGNIAYFGLLLWSWVFSVLTFIRYDISGKENIESGQSYIYTSNHTSFLDLPGLRIAIPTQFRPLAKKELLKIPVFGLIARVTTVVVDRTSNESRKKSISRLRGHIKDGLSLLIFAEGTQNRTKEPLQPFYDGAFRLAIETQTPIMPVVVLNAGKLMPPSTIDVRPGRIKVVFGEPIPVSEEMDIKVLKQKAYDVMLNLLKTNKTI